MSNLNVKYFSTGEFAKLCKVNKQTLIYYDQIGLLTPIMKDDKGYRSYSIAQYDFFSVIELLKEMGMSLKDIQAYMKNKSPEVFLQLMEQQRGIVQEKRRELEMIENIINVKIQATKEAIELDFDSITIQDYPMKTFYLSKNIEHANEEEFIEVVSDFIWELNHSKLDTGHPIGAIIKKEQIVTGNVNNYSYLYIEQPLLLKEQTHFTTVGGLCLVAYHVGDPYDIKQTYEKIFNFMDEINLEIGEHAYEEYVYDAVISDGQQDYVTKIVVELNDM